MLLSVNGAKSARVSRYVFESVNKAQQFYLYQQNLVELAFILKNIKELDYDQKSFPK